MTNFYNIREWAPLTKPFPFRTFPERLLDKWMYILKNLVDVLKSKYGFSGAKLIGMNASGNALLQLNKDYASGPKGFILELPKDDVIFKEVRRCGTYELEGSEFLACCLKKAHWRSATKVALLDIGANTGLVTLQAMNSAVIDNEVFLFEPVPRHVEAIKHNLQTLSKVSKVYVNDFALSDRNGTSKIYTQSSNHGNTSLLKSVVPSKGLITTEVKLVDVREWCNIFLNGFDSYVIKCDTQGMDALILSRIPKTIWLATEGAMIEVWALPEVSELNVVSLIAMWQNFKYSSWNSNFENTIGKGEIREFWLSKSGNSRNLFLSKSI